MPYYKIIVDNISNIIGAGLTPVTFRPAFGDLVPSTHSILEILKGIRGFYDSIFVGDPNSPSDSDICSFNLSFGDIYLYDDLGNESAAFNINDLPSGFKPLSGTIYYGLYTFNTYINWHATTTAPLVANPVENNFIVFDPTVFPGINIINVRETTVEVTLAHAPPVGDWHYYTHLINVYIYGEYGIQFTQYRRIWILIPGIDESDTDTVLYDSGAETTEDLGAITPVLTITFAIQYLGFIEEFPVPPVLPPGIRETTPTPPPDIVPPAATAGNYPGIYTITKDKTNDTVYGALPDTTLVIKIPVPFIRTALFGN